MQLKITFICPKMKRNPKPLSRLLWFWNSLQDE